MKRLILQPRKECYFCGKTEGLHHHEVFFGPNRQNSIKWGCQLWLCPAHHNLSNAGVHMNRHMDLLAKRYTQKAFEEVYGHEKFMEIFHRNYLTENGGDEE